MNSKPFLEFYVSKIDEYLEKKPKHDFGFCWWAYNMYHREHADLCNEQNLRDCTVYTDMAEILDAYCAYHRIEKLDYLSYIPGYNSKRAYRLTRIRDAILLPRIKELS